MTAGPGGDPLGPEVAGFLTRLSVEKSASDHTLRSYRLDLEQFYAWLATGGTRVPVVGGRSTGRTCRHDFAAGMPAAGSAVGIRSCAQ